MQGSLSRRECSLLVSLGSERLCLPVCETCVSEDTIVLLDSLASLLNLKYGLWSLCGPAPGMSNVKFTCHGMTGNLLAYYKLVRPPSGTVVLIVCLNFELYVWILNESGPQRWEQPAWMLNPHVEIQPLVSSEVHLLQFVEICVITELTPLADSICLRYWGSFSNISHQMRHFSLNFQHRKHRFEIQSSVWCKI